MMSTQLQGKTILVTGAAKRVGAAIARRLHRAGANLTLHYHASEREAHALQSELNLQRAQSVMLVQADLLETAGLAEIVKTCAERFGSLDALVNNASAFYPTPVGAISAATWDGLVGANLKAPLFLSQAAAPYLRKVAGCIVNISDIHAERPLKNYVVYSIAKAGLDGLTKSLARELGPEVRVNGIAPGPVLWPERDLDDELKAEIVAKTALKRSGVPEDIARTALFFAVEAPYVTGQVIAVDGGRSL